MFMLWSGCCICQACPEHDGSQLVVQSNPCSALHRTCVAPMNRGDPHGWSVSIKSTGNQMFFMVQVVGAVGWGNARLPIPSDIAPELQELLEKCWDEPTQRPGFEGVLSVLRALVAQPNFVFQSSSEDDMGASQDLSRPVVGL